MGPGTLLQCLLTSALAIASALETVHVNDLDVRAIQADVRAFGVRMEQWQDLDFPNIRNATDRPHGLVIPGGGGTRMKQALMNVLIIRKIHHCNLPIFVYFWGPEEDDERTRKALQGLGGVDVVDGKGLLYPAYHRNIRIPAKEGEWTKNDGWVVKVLALYHAPFQEALLLDADCLPLVNPKVLFSLPAYRKHGSHFWPNYWMGRDPQISSILSIAEPRLQHQTETGQILLNRHQHADVLEWIWFIVTHHDVMYELMYGDTGVFLPGFQLAQKMDQHYQSPYLPRMALFDSGTGEYMHIGMLQSSAGGHPLFMHRAGADKFEWVFEPHYVTHVTGPITPEQAQKLKVNSAQRMYLKAREAELVADLQDDAGDAEKIAVALLKALDQHTQDLLGVQTKRAYECISSWSGGSTACIDEVWD